MRTGLWLRGGWTGKVAFWSRLAGGVALLSLVSSGEPREGEGVPPTRASIALAASGLRCPLRGATGRLAGGWGGVGRTSVRCVAKLLLRGHTVPGPASRHLECWGEYRSCLRLVAVWAVGGELPAPRPWQLLALVHGLGRLPAWRRTLPGIWQLLGPLERGVEAPALRDPAPMWTCLGQVEGVAPAASLWLGLFAVYDPAGVAVWVPWEARGSHPSPIRHHCCCLPSRPVATVPQSRLVCVVCESDSLRFT